MRLHDFALALLSFFSEVTGTLSGFGSSLFFVPLATLFESVQFVLALTAILHCFGNISKIVIFRRHFIWKDFWLLCIPFVLFTGAGAFLVAANRGRSFETALGVFLVIYAAFSLLRPNKALVMPRWGATLLSAVSGFSTGFIGTGGALRGLALSALHLPSKSFVAVSAAIDIGGDFLRAAIYLENGFMDWNEWFYVPVLAGTAYAGTKVGHSLIGRISQKQFEKVVSVFILISGLVMLF